MGKRRIAKSKKVFLKQMFDATLDQNTPQAEGSRFYRRAAQRALAKLEKIRCK